MSAPESRSRGLSSSSAFCCMFNVLPVTWRDVGVATGGCDVAEEAEGSVSAAAVPTPPARVDNKPPSASSCKLVTGTNELMALPGLAGAAPVAAVAAAVAVAVLVDEVRLERGELLRPIEEVVELDDVERVEEGEPKAAL